MVKDAFINENVCVTGKLNSGSRSFVESKIKSGGGKTSSTVTSKTTLLVVGEDPGSKLQKARLFGIKIITDNEFSNIINSKD